MCKVRARMKTQHCALLVIDMQLVAFDGTITPPIRNASPLLSNVATLIGACRSAQIPVLFVQTCAPAGRPYARDVHGWEIHPHVAPKPGERVFFKVGPSGFENPKLHEHLSAMDVNDVLVCGIWSEGCVAYTCRSAIELGYGVCLAADGHSTVRDSDADAAAVVVQQNDALRQQHAGVLATEEILAQLSASTDLA